MSLNFTAVDFETANFHRGSVCAVGITNVRDGQITSSDAWYIDPPTGGRFFTNTGIHGITENDVIGGASWAETVDQITTASHPLYGHVVCFSGAVPTMSRDTARAVAAEHGAAIDLSVTRKTTILVVGDLDPTTLRPGATLSSKIEKAITLAEKGQPVEVMTAADFLTLVDD
ncbi:MAG: hypothetical protein QM677_04995 [Microbacterium sp.]